MASNIIHFASDVPTHVVATMMQLVRESDVASVSSTGHDAGCFHVVASFEGSIYTDLRAKRKRILGVACVQQLLRERRKRWPDGSPPVFCLLMEDMVVCSSGLAPSRQDAVSRMVGYMGGTFKTDFVQSTTHLVCDKPSSSAKYKVALTSKVTPVITSQWIQDMWTQQQVLDWRNYRLKPFLSLLFGAHGLNHQEREAVMTMVSEQGGQWVSSLERNVTHICVADASAANLDAAVRKALSSGSTKLVGVRWVTRCANAFGLLEGGELEGAASSAVSSETRNAYDTPAPPFVAILSSDCPADAALWARQCGGQITDRAKEATVVISPLILPPESPLLTPGRPAMTVHPDWLQESKAQGHLLPMEQFPPRLGRTTPASHGGRLMGLFRGHSFCVTGFDTARYGDLSRSIIEHGGRLVTDSSADYVVLSDGAREPAHAPAHSLVSTSWLKATIASQNAADMAHFASRPLRFATPLESMRSFCISVTGFDDCERVLLADLVERLGATYSERLDKRETTHLVCRSATGPKYDAVVKKGWPVDLVSVDWLLEISISGSVPASADYPVVALSISESGSKPLENVTVFMSRSILSSLRKTCAEVSQSLGAVLVTAWDASVTHYVHQGKLAQRDPVSDQQNVFVVSPAWLFECQKQGSRVSEAQFPSMLNPKRNLVSAVEVEDYGTTPVVKREKRRLLAAGLDDLQATPMTKIKPSNSKRGKVDSESCVLLPAPPAALPVMVSERSASNGHEFHSKLAGLLGELKSIGVSSKGQDDVDQADAEASAPRSRSSSSSSSARGALVNVSGGAGAGAAATITPLLRRAELKGSNVASEFFSGDGEDAPLVTYRDDAQLRKQQRVLETTKSKSRGTGDSWVQPDDDGEQRPQEEKRVKKVKSASASLELSLSLDSMSESKAGPVKRSVPRFFCISKVDNAARKAELTKMLKELGGTLEDAVVANQTGYLLLGELSRTPKFLEATCLGLWVLRPEYVDACHKAGRWIDEESYEWSGDYLADLRSEGRLSSKARPEDLLKLAEAPRIHRMLRRQRPSRRLLGGLRCVFLGSPQKCAPYLKCLELLGGVAIYCGTQPDWDVVDLNDASHVFVDADYEPSRADLAALVDMPLLQSEWVIQCVVQGRLLRSNELCMAKMSAKK